MVKTVPLPSDASVTEIASPSFETTYPEIVEPERLDRLPEGSRFFLDHCWLQRRFEARPLKVIRLRNVFVAGEGLVFDSEFNLLQASVTQQAPDHIEQAQQQLVQAVSDGSMVRRDGPAILCVKPGKANYGHWLIEMLPRVDIAMSIFPGLEPSILVPDCQGAIRPIFTRSLELLGVDPIKIVFSLNGPEWCEDLILVEDMTIHGIYMSPLVFTALDKLAAAVPDQAGADRLYIRRIEPAYRHIVDEGTVARRLAERGYTAIRPETLTLDQQIAAFRRADKVVGVASAALTNIAFCRPGTAVTIFFPDGMADTFYWFIAQHRGLSFTDIRCEQSGTSKTHMPWDADIIVPDRHFDQYMQ